MFHDTAKLISDLLLFYILLGLFYFLLDEIINLFIIELYKILHLIMYLIEL